MIDQERVVRDMNSMAAEVNGELLVLHVQTFVQLIVTDMPCYVRIVIIILLYLLTEYKWLSKSSNFKKATQQKGLIYWHYESVQMVYSVEQGGVFYCFVWFGCCNVSKLWLSLSTCYCNQYSWVDIIRQRQAMVNRHWIHMPYPDRKCSGFWQTSNDKEKQTLSLFFDYLDQIIIYITSSKHF